MFFRQVFDPELAQYAYLIGCQRTGEALVIDPERDIDRYVEIANEEGLRIVAATETHIHADFLSGAREFAEQHGTKLYLSDEGDEDWKYTWAKDSDYDVHFLKDNDTFQVGNIRIQAIHTPGHTPEHMSFLVTDLGGGASEPIGIASGDFVFVGDLGRPDLLETAAGVTGAREPSARRLFDSTKRFLALEDHVQVWPGHGAGSACGKALGAVPQSTVGYERRFNAALSFREEQGFVDAILDGQPEPPIYFARMKQLNKSGVPILGDLPLPKACSIDELAENGREEGAVIVDTRPDRKGFMAGHIPGSLHAPLGINFAMIVGSYVDPETNIYLLIDHADLEEAVRTLVRIGYDHVAGYASPAALVERGLSEEVIDRIDFTDLPAETEGGERTVLDVRSAAEFRAGHVPGAMNIAHTRLAARLDEVPRDKPVMTYCRSGNRASAAAALLASEGYDVTLVDGLFDVWPGRSKAEKGEPAGAA
ncbi:MAG: MBL fold metallo-hydrolase [Gemmatimonadetes bacterium]|nr:MBL fold metallo-hydrolase [Gemmatimonadota bacterium]NNL30996.1 MBL fold metallo-hydrolase [Gemmatimonadota bacterium]